MMSHDTRCLPCIEALIVLDAREGPQLWGPLDPLDPTVDWTDAE